MDLAGIASPEMYENALPAGDPEDAEIQVIQMIVKNMSQLPLPSSRTRVLRYLMDRYGE